MVVEDAHWIDPTTLELLGQALDRIAGARVLMLLTNRPDNQPALGGHPHLTRLTLNRLGRGPTEAIVTRLTGGRSLPPEILAEIAARTDGVPLFIGPAAPPRSPRPITEPSGQQTRSRCVRHSARTPPPRPSPCGRAGPTPPLRSLRSTLEQYTQMALREAQSPWGPIRLQPTFQQLGKGLISPTIADEGVVFLLFVGRLGLSGAWRNRSELWR
jgi:hypothetical protein